MSYKDIINIILNPKTNNLGNVGEALVTAAKGKS